MTTREERRDKLLTAILGFPVRRFLFPALAALALNGCGSGGGGGGEASSQPPQQSISGAAVTIAEVTNPASPVIAAVTDNNGKEKFAIVGTKDVSGAPVTMTEVLYISASGDAGTLVVGLDGLPLSLSDAVGNKVMFANFTDTTVEITVFDQAGNQVAGPLVVAIDSAVLTRLRGAHANLAQGFPVAQGVSFAAALFGISTAEAAPLGVSTQDWIKTEVNVAGLGLGLAGCGAIVVASTLPAGPLGVMAGAACVSTLVEAAQQIQGTDSPPGMEYDSAAGDAASCSLGATTGDLFECLDLIVDGLGLVLEADFTAPSVPTGLTVSVVQQNKVSFYWTGSIDDVAVAGYRIYRNGSLVANIPITYYRDQNVVPETQYCYRVEAYDAAGHSSGVSDALCVTVPPATLSALLYVCDDAGVLGKVDVATGNVTIIGSMGVVMTDIAFAPNGDLYGVTYDALYKIDPTTTAVAFIGNLGASGINALVFRSDGTLFAASLTAQLYMVNTTTGQSSYVGYTLYGSAGDLEFDPDGKLLMAALGVNLIELATTADGSGSVFHSLIAAATPYSFFGLAIGTQGMLYGVAGTEIVSIDRSTWQAVNVVNYAGQGLGVTYGASRRW